jgi:hypothetical protein
MPIPFDLNWAGGEHAFALDIGSLRAIQTATGRGPMEVYTALSNGSWRIDDVLSVLRYGLIGGGMEANAARDLVNRIADATPMLQLAPAAHIVMAWALVGPADDQVGAPPKDDAAAEKPVGPAAAPSNSASSTPMAPKPGSRRRK